MPELPEVEVNRQGLAQLIKGKYIENIKVYWPRIVVAYDETENWANNIINKQIIAVKRRGKYLVFELSEGYLVSHLRMEGKYFYYSEGDLPAEKHKHTHVFIQMGDQSELHYNDVRKFGRMEYVNAKGLESFFTGRKLGPEPFKETFILQDFESNLSRTKQAIKGALLSQQYVAGLGNIYVDEVLFISKIHPLTSANKLTKNEIERLHRSIIVVMHNAILAGGSSIRTYYNTVGEAGNYQKQLKVYGRTNLPCANCETLIEKIKVAQRGTHYCPNCQKLS